MSKKDKFQAGINQILAPVPKIETTEQLVDFVHKKYPDIKFNSVDELVAIANGAFKNQHFNNVHEIINFLNHQNGHRVTLTSADEIYNLPRLDNADLSNLDLRDYDFVGELPGDYIDTQTAKEHKIILNWTDNIIWPPADRLPDNFDPNKILQDAKHTAPIEQIHKMGATGKNIGIAIIDQTANITHPEYAERVKHCENFGPFAKNTPDYHPSLVAGCAIGKTTGTAPDADLYFYGGAVTPTPTGKKSRKHAIEALRAILKTNATLPENKKIRFVSCSWGGPTDELRPECEAMYTECEKHGIMVVGGFWRMVGEQDFDTHYYNPLYAPKENTVGIPTNGKTTPFYKGGYYYTRQGGASSEPPYLAGVFACALQGNTIFCTRNGWQDELIDIMKQTATKHEHGGRIINPTGIRETVTQIARQMEMDLIKQHGTQHE